MDAIRAAMSCIPCTKSPPKHPRPTDMSDEDIAEQFVAALLGAEKRGKALDEKLDAVVGATGWTWEENLGKVILAKLERAIAIGAQMSSAMKDAVEKSVATAGEFAREHPVYTTLIAIGVLAVLSPWVLEAVGFGELGPIEGSFAAAWQRTYAGYVPREALFAYLQRLGMIWRRYPKANWLLRGVTKK